MSFLGIWLSLILSLNLLASQSAASEVVGHWHFYKVVLNGEERPPFNPNLQIRWLFLPSGFEMLSWERTGERGFCKRLARYEYSNPILRNEVVWLDPENSWDCSRDPDMHLGRKAQTKVSLNGEDLWLHFRVSDDEVAYVFKRIRGLSSNRSP